MFDYIFVDLDDTIFDTAKFKADIYKTLSVFDVKEADFIYSWIYKRENDNYCSDFNCDFVCFSE